MKPPASQFRSKPSSLESLFAAQLEAAGIRFEREFRFWYSRRWRADFFVQREASPDLFIDALVEVQGTGPQGRHGSYGHHDSDCEKFSTAAALGWRVLPLSAKMVRDGSGLALVEAALGLKPVPVRPSKPPTKRSKIPKRASASKLPERVLRAAGMKR